MSDPARVTGLISDIQDAARDSSRWPHVLRRAVAIGQVLEREASKAAAFSDVLDRLSVAIVFIDGKGRLVHANDPATGMLAEGRILRWEKGKPRPRCEQAFAHLQSLLASASRAHPATACTALYTIDATAAGERVAIHVLPIRAGSRRHALAPRAAAAAILVSRLAPDLVQRVGSIARLYAFTPAESRVAQALLDRGATVSRIAATLGVAEATVKTHLQHIFDKTATRCRADLVQLIAAGGAAAP